MNKTKKKSIEDLIQACINLRKNLNRDKIEFNEINIDAGMATNFEAKLASVKQIEQDSIIREKIKFLTQKKSKQRKQLHVAIRKSLLFMQAFMSEDSTLQMKGFNGF